MVDAIGASQREVAWNSAAATTPPTVAPINCAAMKAVAPLIAYRGGTRERGTGDSPGAQTTRQPRMQAGFVPAEPRIAHPFG